MNRNVVVTIGVLIIIAAAVGGYVFLNRSAMNPSAVQTENEAMTPVETTNRTSLKSFMSMGGTQKCEFNDSDTGSAGTVYLNSGEMRGDFTSKIAEKQTSTHMINDGSSMYIWMDDQTTGFKTTLASVEEMSQREGTTGVSQTVDINKQSLAMLTKQVDYKCESWTVDPTKFAVPVEVKFQDMAEMLKNLPNMMQSGSPSASVKIPSSAEACVACNNLEGDAQTQCKRVLKCN